jgi:hypothetical protein
MAKDEYSPRQVGAPIAAKAGLLRAYASLPPEGLSPSSGACLISGENWFCFVKQPIGKYQSISVEVLILRRRHQRLFQPFPKIAFSVFV